MQNNIVFSGIVIHGKELGRTIGYPTANIAISRGTVADGVYALHISLGDETYSGVGTYRESIELFEAHIFGFEADIYGSIIDITVIRKIRNNQKFDSFQDLKLQIAKDAEDAKK